MEITFYNAVNRPSPEVFDRMTEFLYTHLETYGDPLSDICKAAVHALEKPGGFIAAAQEEDGLVAVAILNRTGMEGYVPENILVYIAVRADRRGCGTGRRLLAEVIRRAEGDIALHVEPGNPAVKLYESLGFASKYVEMRLRREA